MAEQKLREFFREKFKKAPSTKVDWKARRDAWVRAIQELYRTIRDRYLAGPIKDGTVTVSVQEKRIIEDFIGVYVVNELILQVGTEAVIFSPVGTNIAGATGRVDVRGDLGETTIIRQPGDRWSVVVSRTPTLRMVPLNEVTLLEALKHVMRT
jgi:hypothetical protein